METYPKAFDRMLDAWNERDASKIRGHLDASLNDDVWFVDPTIDLTDVDTHHKVHRYHWAIHVNGHLVVQGFDVAESKTDKVSLLIGFFGELSLNENSL
jgi:hypothetical protein